MRHTYYWRRLTKTLKGFSTQLLVQWDSLLLWLEILFKYCIYIKITGCAWLQLTVQMDMSIFVDFPHLCCPFQLELLLFLKSFQLDSFELASSPSLLSIRGRFKITFQHFHSFLLVVSQMKWWDPVNIESIPSFGSPVWNEMLRANSTTVQDWLRDVVPAYRFYPLISPKLRQFYGFFALINYYLRNSRKKLTFISAAFRSTSKN